MRNQLKTVIKGIGRFFRPNPTLLDLIDEMEQLLDISESQPVRFEASPNTQFELVALAEGAKILARKAQSLGSKKGLSFFNKYLYKTVSLQYRLEAVNGGAAPLSVQQATVNLLKKEAFEWKGNQELIENKELTQEEIYQLQVASQYPEFVELMTQDDELKGKFFLWVIRDKNEARVFIEYPSLCEKIAASNLSGRIGRINKKDLKIQKVTNAEGVEEKIVTLPFEGIDRNILDGNALITFRGNYQLTVDEIFKVFEDKGIEVGNLEYLALGISNWNCHKWGFWNADKKTYEAIDLNHHQWWQQLPIIELISREEAQNRYNKTLDGKEWCVAATATRGAANLDFENTHAFLEMAIPFGDGRYAIYDFGKFAKKYPKTFFEGVSIFCHNLQATVSYPDENIFYSHRQQTFHAFVVTEEQGREALELVKADMIKGIEENFVYQIESDNCAKWVHELLETTIGKENVPDMFRMHLLDTEPEGPVATIFHCIKMLPESMQTRVMTFCHLFLGARKQTWILENGQYVCKSLTRHDFWKTGIIYLPALLYKKIEANAFEIIEDFVEKIVHTGYSFLRSLLEPVLQGKQDTTSAQKITLWQMFRVVFNAVKGRRGDVEEGILGKVHQHR